MAYIQDFDENQVYELNAITTLTATYKGKHALSLLSAEEKISSFLAIDNTTSIQTVQNQASILQSQFDHSEFMDQASQNSGFDNFINILINEIDQGIPEHSFKGHEPIEGLFGDLLGWFGGNLANGAVSYLGGQAMGWAMNMLGYQSADDKILEKLDQISNKLNQLDQKLDAITSEING